MITCENDFHFKCEKCRKDSIERLVNVKSSYGITEQFIFRAHSACLSSDAHNDRLIALDNFIENCHKIEKLLCKEARDIELNYGQIDRIYFGIHPPNPCDNFEQVTPYVCVKVSGREQEFNLEKTSVFKLKSKKFFTDVVPIANEIAGQMKTRIDRGLL